MYWHNYKSTFLLKSHKGKKKKLENKDIFQIYYDSSITN